MYGCMSHQKQYKSGLDHKHIHLFDKNAGSLLKATRIAT